MGRPVEIRDEGGLDVDSPVVLSDDLREVERQPKAKPARRLFRDVHPGLDSAERVGLDRGDARTKLRRDVDREKEEKWQCCHNVRYAHSRLKGTLLRKTPPSSCTRRMSLGLTPIPRSES